MTTNQSVETDAVQFVEAWRRVTPETEPITTEQLLNIHRQMVSAIKEINRALGREVTVIVKRN